MPKPGEVTHTVYVTAIDVVVTRDIYCGVSGPFATVVTPATLEEVDAWLASLQMNRTEAWRLTRSYEGLCVEALVEFVHTPVELPTVVEWTKEQAQ